MAGLFFVGHHRFDDAKNKGVDDLISPLVSLHLGLDYSLILEDREVLGNDRLRLVQANPKFRYAGFFLLFYHAKKFEPHGMAANLEFLGAFVHHFFGAAIFKFHI
jgi:hypothetical protein